ncbi:MAG: hypothetical protein LQ352_003415, partial [Teloschistes flavicans]
MASNDNSKWDIDSTAPTAEVKGNLDTDEPETGWDENAVESQERVGTIAQWDAWETGKDTGLDEHCGIEQSTGKVLAATDADRSIVDEDAFETYYARQYERSAHLAVPSEDGTDWQEIAGMNESNKATHALHCSLVFDREQSYLEIKFTVRRDDATLYLSTHQHFSIRYYVNSITDLSYPRLTQVTSDSEIQPKLRNNIKAMRAFEQGSLWMLTLSHKESLCGRHGIFDTPTFSDPARLQDLETLRVAAQASEYDLFLILGSTSFAKTLETLKAKFKAESGKLPFAEYCSKRGNYVCEWGLEDFGRDKDTYERAPTNTFRSIKQWQLTHGYGVMRDCTVELDAVEKTLNNSMQASFIALDVPKDGLPQYYLALVQCNDELLIRKVYNVGDRGVLAWEEPYQGSEVPSGWSYTVKPPLPVADCPGNLVLLIKRRKEVTFAIPFSRMPHLNMEQQKVWAYPEVSDASPRRLVACTKLIAEKISGPAAQELKRYLLAKDLRERDPSSEMAQRAARIFPSRTDTNVSQKVKEVFQQFSESQGMAYDHLVDMAPAHAVILIQGPPGTSKTKFLSILFQIAWHTNSDGIGGASSNAGTDHLATTNNKTSPEMGSMRYHTWHGESRALQRYNDDTKTGHAIAEIPEDEFANIQDAEGAKAFNKFLVHISQNAPEWTVREKQRPNFTTMSLHVRSLQNTGVIEHDIPGFKRAEGEDQNKYAKFRQALLGKHFDGSAPASETGPDLQADYNAAETDLMRETMKISGAIFTTNHKMGDFELKNGKRPVWIGLEEGGESNEIESVIGWAHHVKTVALVVIVGDHKQLPPNVMTKSMNRENDLVNPFAPQ